MTIPSAKPVVISPLGSRQPNKVHYVDPAKIIYGCHNEFEVDKYTGLVKAGDWDLDQYKFDDEVIVLQSLKMIKHGLPWEQTPFYKWRMECIAGRVIRYNCSTKEDVVARCEFVERMYLNTLNAGYIPMEYMTRDNIAINIDRNGRMLYNNGRHRLACAKLAEVEVVPVEITVRHSDWMRTRKIMESRATHKGRLYNDVEHIDLQHLLVAYTGRGGIILNHIDRDSTTVLDIGCMTGYFCGILETAGYTCTAVERDPNVFRVLELMRIANEHTFRTVNDSIENFITTDERNEYDTVLAMRIFHHFRKTEEGVEKLKYILNHLAMKELFLQEQPANPGGQMDDAYLNLKTNADCARFVVQNSCLTTFEQVADSDTPGGAIYRIYK